MSLLRFTAPALFRIFFFFGFFSFLEVKARQDRRRWREGGHVRVIDDHRGVGCGSERASRIYCIRPSFRTSWRPELAGPQHAGDFAIAYCVKESRIKITTNTIIQE
jgi:hypothetical protein